MFEVPLEFLETLGVAFQKGILFDAAGSALGDVRT
jgi:hypothetical protein